MKQMIERERCLVGETVLNLWMPATWAACQGYWRAWEYRTWIWVQAGGRAGAILARRGRRCWEADMEGPTSTNEQSWLRSPKKNVITQT